MKYMKKPTKQSQPRIKIYLSKAEDAMLRKQARDLRLSVSAYLRGLIRTEGDHLEKR
jgi:hypothetical protein